MHLFTAGEEDDDLLLQVAPDEGEQHVDLLVQLTHHVVLLQSGRSAGGHTGHTHRSHTHTHTQKTETCP